MKWLFSLLVLALIAEVAFFLRLGVAAPEESAAQASWTQSKKGVELAYWFPKRSYRATLRVQYPSSELTRVDDSMVEVVQEPHFALQDSPERLTLLDAAKGQFNWRTSLLAIQQVHVERFVEGKKIVDANAREVEITLKGEQPEVTAFGLTARKLS